MAGDAILDVIEAASRALAGAGVRHALIGGAALPAWGRSRATADADLLLNLDLTTAAGRQAADRVVGALRQAGFAHLERADRRILEGRCILHFWFPIRDRGFSIRLDLFLAAGAEERRILDRAVARRVDGFTVVVASCEDLILLKLTAARPVDLADAAELLAIHRDTLDHSYLRAQAAVRGLQQPLKEADRRAGG